MSRDIHLAFLRIAELGLTVNHGQPINGQPGAWHYRFSASEGWEWEIAVNPHRAPVRSPMQSESEIDPFEAHVYVNDWPFAILSPIGDGVIGNGEGANEETFIAALEAEIRRLGGEPSPAPSTEASR